MSLLSVLGGAGCASCPRDRVHADIPHPKLRPEGAAHPEIYMLGGTALSQDHLEGRVWGMPAQEVVHRLVRQVGLEHVRWGYLQRCATLGPRAQLVERACCASLLHDDLSAHTPRVIVLVGQEALTHFAGPSARIGDWQNVPFPVQVGARRSWGIAMLSPLEIAVRAPRGGRAPEVPLEHVLMRKVLEHARSLRVDTVPPVVSYKDVRPEPWSASVRERVLASPALGIDLETTCLSPYEPHAAILTCALYSEDVCTAFTVSHPDGPPGVAILRDVLESYQGRLGAHNLPFELSWLLHFFGAHTVLNGIEWHDSMCAVREYIHRETPLSLDDSAFIVTGSRPKGVTGVNPTMWRGVELPRFLRYNAVDAAASFHILTTLRGWESSSIEYRRLREASAAVSLMRNAPLPLAQDVLTRRLEEYETRRKDLLEELAGMPTIARFANKQGAPFDPFSPPQTAALIGKPSAREEDVAAWGDPAGALILEVRRVDKILSTYLRGWRSAADAHGDIHPQYSVCRVATGRLSSADPNIQNVPKRRDRWVRELLTAPTGMTVLSIDYSQLEIRVIAAMSQEPTLIQELWENADLHSRWTDRVIALHPAVMDRLRRTYETSDEGKLRKALRDEIKRGVSFALPYGASDTTPARILQLPAHVGEALVAEYWAHYPRLRAWQERLRDFYSRTGEITFPSTGRTREGWLSGNEPINNPIQGTGSDIVVAAMVCLAKRACAEGDPYFLPRINIHDDLTFIVPTFQLEHYAAAIAESMVAIRFPHIQVVPYVVEASAGPNWYQQSTLRQYSSVEFGHRRERRRESTPHSLAPEAVFGGAWTVAHRDSASGAAPVIVPAARIPLRRPVGGGEDHVSAPSRVPLRLHRSGGD